MSSHKHFCMGPETKYKNYMHENITMIIINIKDRYTTFYNFTLFFPKKSLYSSQFKINVHNESILTQNNLEMIIVSKKAKSQIQLNFYLINFMIPLKKFITQ